MSDEIIQIMSVKPIIFKSGKSGFKFNDRFNIFDADLANKLKAGIGSAFKFDVTKDPTGKYENIRQMGSPIGEVSTQRPHEAPRPIAQPTPIVEVEAVKQNSRTWGKGDDQVKIYFDSLEDLKKQTNELIGAGFMPKAYYVAMDEAYKYLRPTPIEDIKLPISEKPKDLTDFNKPQTELN